MSEELSYKDFIIGEIWKNEKLEENHSLSTAKWLARQNVNISVHKHYLEFYTFRTRKL